MTQKFTVFAADFEGEMIPMVKTFDSLNDATTAVIEDLTVIYRDMGLPLPEVTFQEKAYQEGSYEWVYMDEYENMYRIYNRIED